MPVKPIMKKNVGHINATIFEGDYQGKPTYSVAFQKSYQDKEGNWKDTNFMSMTDLRDLYILVTGLVTGQVKSRKIEPKPEQQAAQEYGGSQVNPEDDIPF